MRIILISIILLLLSGFPGLAENKNVYKQGKITQEKFYFGMRTTAPPISYFDQRSAEYKGYCYALIQTLKKTFPNIEIVRFALDSRFTGEKSGGKPLDAECAPNTITPRRRELINKNGLDGKFSRPFVRTSAAALGLKHNIQKLNSGDIEKLKFGVIKGTTTEDIVNSRYPSLDKKNFVDLDDSEDGMSKFREDKIDIYFDDEVILWNFQKELNQASKKEEKYSIQSGYSNEDYGVIVYRTNELQNHLILNKINSLLSSAKKYKINDTGIKTYFKILDNNQYFKTFLKENNLSYPNIKNQPIALRFDDYIWLIVFIIAIVSITLWFKYRNTYKYLQYPTLTYLKKIKQSASSKNSYSNARDIMTNNNFDQRGSTINVGVQGENSGVSNQQNFQNNTCTPEDKQKIKEIAQEIKRILEKIDNNIPNTTDEQKKNIVSYEISPEKRNKAVKVLKAGGEEALKEFLDNPYLNIAMAIVKEWRNEE